MTGTNGKQVEDAAKTAFHFGNRNEIKRLLSGFEAALFSHRSGPFLEQRPEPPPPPM
jgi:hypothetical protein